MFEIANYFSWSISHSICLLHMIIPIIVIWYNKQKTSYDLSNRFRSLDTVLITDAGFFDSSSEKIFKKNIYKNCKKLFGSKFRKDRVIVPDRVSVPLLYCIICKLSFFLFLRSDLCYRVALVRDLDFDSDCKAGNEKFLVPFH